MKLAPAAAESAPAPPRNGRDGSRRDRSRRYAVGIVLAGVLLVAVAFRFVTKSDLWLDEALTVNIAKLPLGDLRAALERDGAPPLYYVLLHGWMRVFGTTDVAVRALSGVLGLAMLPLAYLAGRRLGGSNPDTRRWVAWSAVLVVASSPYAIRYSTEARMYMLAMDLVLLGYLAVTAAVARPTVLRLAGVALVTGALLYTQYWAFFLVGVFGALVVARALFGPRPERATAWKLIGALVVGGVLFVPWLPTFISQMQHTGTPWDSPVSPPTNAALGIVDFAGGKMLEGWSLVLPLVLLALLGLFARAVDARHAEINVMTVPGVRWEWLVGAATLIGGLTLSYLGGTGFQSRYAAVIYPLFALAVAFGVLVFADLRIRVGVLAVVVLLGFVGGVRNVITNRTQASQVVAQIVGGSSPGDVVGFCPDQLGPDVSRILDARGVQQYAFPNLQSPKFVNWVDYADRNAAASAEKYADALLAKAGDHRVWMVWSSGYRTFGSKCEDVLNRLAAARGGTGDLVVPDDEIYEFMGLRRYDP